MHLGTGRFAAPPDVRAEIKSRFAYKYETYPGAPSRFTIQHHQHPDAVQDEVRIDVVDGVEVFF